MSAFISCMYTNKLASVMEGYKNLQEIVMSTPRYNIKNTSVQDLNAHDIKTVDIPAYGIHINEALENLFNTKELAKYVAEYDLPFAVTVERDLFFLSKLDKLKFVLDVVYINGGVTIKLEKFIKYLEVLNDNIKLNKPLPTKAEYYKFLDELFETEWKDRLHFNKVLLNFGVTEEINTQLFSQENEKICVDFKASVAWISKALTMFKFGGGCIADIVNYIAAALHHTKKGHINGEIFMDDSKNETALEKNITRMISNFTKALSKPDLLWAPDIHFHDCETDDILTMILINFIRTKQGNPMVHACAQLPSDKKAERIVERLGKLNSVCFYDKDSENMRVLEKTYKL